MSVTFVADVLLNTETLRLKSEDGALDVPRKSYVIWKLILKEQ